jgi:dihydrofolate synthase/folylpolyglutamate synthase
MSTQPSSLTPLPVAPRRSGFQTLQEWLDWQVRLHFTAIELGLDRCRSVAERMGLLNPGFAVVSIAGTNGKGSSAAMLDQILRRASYRTGRYTSPHLLRYNERICVNGVEVTDEQLCRSFQRIDEARDGVSLTFFEFGTLAAMDIFRGADIDLAIMEVGLGGRLDAVNVFDADVALLTSVDLDHEDWLGHDRESIGREKVGIFRGGRPAVCADPSPPASVERAAIRLGARLHRAGREFHCEEHGDTWSWRFRETRLTALPRPFVHHARYVQNAAGVLAVLALLDAEFPVTDTAIRTGLAEFRLPGRLQIVPGAVSYVLDVAHNPEAAAVLAANLGQLPCTGGSHVVLGMLRDKNHRAVLKALSSSAQRWYFASLGGDRGCPAGLLAEAFAAIGNPAPMTQHDSVAAAIDAAAAAARAGDRIVVAGSFVTVGEAMSHLNVRC